MTDEPDAAPMRDHAVDTPTGFSPATALDHHVSKLPGWVRGWGAIFVLVVTIFSLGFAAGQWRVRDRIDRQDDRIEDGRQERQDLGNRISSNAAQIATLEAMFTQAGIGELAKTVDNLASKVNAIDERTRRMDREACIRAANNISEREQCASR